MRPARIHARIIQHPFAPLVLGARLDSSHEDKREFGLDKKVGEEQVREVLTWDKGFIKTAENDLNQIFPLALFM